MLIKLTSFEFREPSVIHYLFQGPQSWAILQHSIYDGNPCFTAEHLVAAKKRPFIAWLQVKVIHNKPNFCNNQEKNCRHGEQDDTNASVQDAYLDTETASRCNNSNCHNNETGCSHRYIMKGNARLQARGKIIANGSLQSLILVFLFYNTHFKIEII